MKHIAAALLLALGEKDISNNFPLTTLDEANINATLASVGVKPNPAVVKAVVDACKGKSPQDLIRDGLSKLAVASGVAVGAATSAPADKKEDKKDDKKKKEEKKEEPAEEEDAGVGDLFGF